MSRWVGYDRLLIGRDIPWTPFPEGKILFGRLTDGLGDIVGDSGADTVFQGNAKKLFGRGYRFKSSGSNSYYIVNV